MPPKMSIEEYLLDIQDRIDDDDDVTEEEIMIYISACTDTPYEILEARLAELRGDDLLTLDEDLPMTGSEEEDYEDYE